MVTEEQGLVMLDMINKLTACVGRLDERLARVENWVFEHANKGIDD